MIGGRVTDVMPLSTLTAETTKPFWGAWALAIPLAPASQITATDSALTAFTVLLGKFVTRVSWEQELDQRGLPTPPHVATRSSDFT